MVGLKRIAFLSSLCKTMIIYILNKKKGIFKNLKQTVGKWYIPENLMNTAFLHVICRLSQNYELQIVQKLPKKCCKGS